MLHAPRRPAGTPPAPLACMSRGSPHSSSPRAPRSASEHREAAGGTPRPAAGLQPGSGGLRGALGSEAGRLRREPARQAGRSCPGAGSRSRGGRLSSVLRALGSSLVEYYNGVPPRCAPLGLPSFTRVCSFLSSDGRKGCASHLRGAGHLCSTLDFSLSVFHALALHSYGKREGPGPDKTRIQRGDGYKNVPLLSRSKKRQDITNESAVMFEK